MGKQTLQSLAQVQTPSGGSTPSGGQTDWLNNANQVVENIRKLVKELSDAGLINANLAGNVMPPEPDARRTPEKPQPKQQQQQTPKPDTMRKFGALILMYLEMECQRGKRDMPIGEYIASLDMPLGDVTAQLRKAMQT